jgi:hypothetical protein
MKDFLLMAVLIFFILMALYGLFIGAGTLFIGGVFLAIGWVLFFREN